MSSPRVGILYSGGKDSTLAALVLDSFYDVTLVTAHFGISGAWEQAKQAAAAFPYAFQTLELDRTVAESAVETMVEDGYPRNGIQSVHEHALETIATEDFEAIADGTRRDDRVPTISRATAQSIEDRHGVDYLAPLSGFGRSTVDRLVKRHLAVTTGPSEEIPRADYEAELRALIRDKYGDEQVQAIFPAHDQTIVTGYQHEA